MNGEIEASIGAILPKQQARELVRRAASFTKLNIIPALGRASTTAGITQSCCPVRKFWPQSELRIEFKVSHEGPGLS